MLQPQFVQHAAESAQLLEMTVEALMKKHKPLTEIHTANSSVSSQLKGNPNHMVYTNLNSTKSLLMKQTRQAGLYYQCGEQFSPTHRCRKQLLYMEGLKDGKEGEEEKVGIG